MEGVQKRQLLLECAFLKSVLNLVFNYFIGIEITAFIRQKPSCIQENKYGFPPFAMPLHLKTIQYNLIKFQSWPEQCQTIFHQFCFMDETMTFLIQAVYSELGKICLACTVL